MMGRRPLQESPEPNRRTVNQTVRNWNRRNRSLTRNRWNRNRTELEPGEPDFGVGKMKMEWRGLPGVVFYADSEFPNET